MTDPVTAARAALDALKVRRIALLTPYVRRINESLRAALAARGMEIPVMGSFNQDDDNVVARIAPQSIADAIIGLGASEACDGVFVSCTSLRVARIVEEVEAKLGKPVTSSNHALAWHMLRLAGYTTPLPKRGRLFLVRAWRTFDRRSSSREYRLRLFPDAAHDLGRRLGAGERGGLPGPGLHAVDVVRLLRRPRASRAVRPRCTG